MKVTVPLGIDDAGSGSEAMLRAAAGGVDAFLSPVTHGEASAGEPG